MSGSNAEVIRSFLVEIGYQERGRAGFVASMGGVAKEAARLGLAVKAAALAVTAAVSVIASSLNDLYFASQRTGASVEGIKALGYAASQMGSSVGEARSSLEALGRFVRTNPGGEGFIQSLGVATRTASGELRDMAVVTGELGVRLGQMGVEKYAYANLLGIDEKTLIAITQGVGEFSATYRAMVQAAGVDLQQAAKDGQAFTGELGTLGAAVDLLQVKVNSALTRRMSDDIRRFREWLVSNFETISAAITWVADKLLIAAGVVTQLAGRTVDAVRDISGWWGTLSESNRTLTASFAALVVGWRLLNAAFLASPIGLVIAALGGAFLLLYDDFKVWQEGGKSLIDWDKWKPALDATMTALGELGGALKGLGTEVVGDLVMAFNRLFEVLPAGFKQVFAVDLSRYLRDSVDEFRGFINFLTKLVDLVTALLSADPAAMRRAAQGMLDVFPSADQMEANRNASQLAAVRRMRSEDQAAYTAAELPDGSDGRTWGERNLPVGLGGRAPAPNTALGRAAAEQLARTPEGASTGGAPGGGSAAPAADTSTGPFNARAGGYVERLMRDMGLTRAQAAAVIGHGGHESGLTGINERNPLIPGSRGGRGWMQWTGPRRRAFEAYAAEHGLDPNQDETNYRFLTHEMQSTPHGRSATNALRASNGVEQGVQAFLPFETGGDPRAVVNMPSRLRFARQAYEASERSPEANPQARAPRPVAQRQSAPDVPPALPDAPAPLRTPLPAPGPLMTPGTVDNSQASTFAPVVNQTATINVTGAGQDAARQVLDGQRDLGAGLVRGLQSVAR